VLLAVLAGRATFGTSLYATGRAGAELPARVGRSCPPRLIGTVALARLPLAFDGAGWRATRSRPSPLDCSSSGVCEVLGFFSYTGVARAPWHRDRRSPVLSVRRKLAALGAYVIFRERLTRIQLGRGSRFVIAGIAVLSARLRG